MKLKRLTALLCAAATALPAVGYSMAAAGDDTITLTKSGGALESVYAEWKNTEAAASYTVTCTDASGSVTAVDSQLIRLYSDHYRVDVPGLKAGTYTLSISDSNGSSVTTDSINVAAHTREGFAFSAASPNGGIASGGYNADGTPASNAVILYVTQENVNSVQLKIGSKTYTGLCNVLVGISNATKNGNNSASANHYIIRLIGTIDGSKVNFNGSSDATHHNFYVQDLKNLTIEGIGEDTVLDGCAFFIKGCSNVELRNIAEMLFLDDGIAIDGNNSNIWVHNNDIFYGKDLSPETGDGTGDTDQVKGDGSLDIKNSSRYCTLSYNHFWDGGKVSLVIAGHSKFDDATSFLSYHHNWFDHSDSRHPRVRFATVHMYNNYFDGIQGYGSGVTSGASLFAEANYYKDCARPFASSMQGTDKGTFSKEAGGIIKVYGNYHDGKDNTIYYSSKTGSDFDAYKASSRAETVPSTVTTKLNTFKGYTYNNVYNNFDTDSSMYSYTPDNAENVPALVKNYAGRVNGGDISYTFSSDDVSDHSRMSNLDKLLLNYTPSVVMKLLSSYPATDGEIVIPTAPPAGDLKLVNTAKTWTFEDYGLTELYNNMKFYFTDSKPIGITGTTYDKTYSTALDLQGAGSLGEYRAAEVYVASGEVKINFENTGSSDRVLLVYVNGKLMLEQDAKQKKAVAASVNVSGNSYVQFMSKSGGLRICSVDYEPSAVPPTEAPTPTAAAAPTATPTAPPPTEPPTPTPTATVAPTATPEPTATPTATPEPTATPTATPEPTATSAPTGTPDPTSRPEETTAPTEPPELALTASSGTDSDGNLVVSAELTMGVSAKLIAAQYADGRLIAIVPVDTNIDEPAYDITLPNEDGCTVKLMLWSDFTGIVPLIGAVTVLSSI